MARTIASILRDGQDPSMPALRQWLQALSTSVSATVMGFRAFPALADLNAYTPTGTEPTYAFTTDDGLTAYKYEGGTWAVDDSFYQGFGALTDPLVEELTAVTTRVSDSEAALDALALDNLAYIGRPGDATLVNGTAKGSGAVFWHDRVDDIGELTALDIFDRAPGTVNVAVYRGANETLSRVGMAALTITGTGAQRRYTLDTHLDVRAGDVLALQATDNALAVAELQSGDAGYTYAAPFLPETFTLGTPSMNGQMQVRFVIAYRDQVVTADRFVEAEANAVLGALASDGIDLLSADATEFIGRPGTATLVDGTATGNGSIYWRDVVDHAGTLDAIDVFAKAAGTLKIAVYRGAASALTRVALATVATPGGAITRTLALSAPLDVLPGDILALQPQAAGLLTVAEIQSGDAGYTYSFPDLPTSIALGAPTTNGQVQVRFRVSYRKQVVTTDAFLALGETKIVGASALALSSGSRARVQIDAKVFGAKPDRFEISWRGYSVSVKSLPFVLPDQAEVKDFAVSGNSIDDATDTPKWHTILAARRGKQSHFTARYSSDGRQTFRAGLDELVFTFADNSVAAGGTAKAIASINGKSPIDPSAGYAFLNTGDANLTTGVTLSGILIDLETGVTRRGVTSIPNASSAAYSFTQDAGLSALTLSGPALFLPDIAAEFARCDNFCGIGNNLFYSGVPGAYGDFTNASLYPVIDKFAAAAQGQRFMTRDVLPAGEWPADGSPNVIGGVDYKTHMFAAMEAWNARNEANHPGSRPRSLPTSGFPNGRTALKYLQDHGNGSAADNAAIAQGKIPISLWSDGPHPNAAGQIVLADFYQEAMQRQALAPSLPVGTTVTITALSMDPSTGEVVRNIAYATVRLGDLAAAVEPLRNVIDTIAEEADYRPTIAAAIADFAPGKFFTSRDLDGVTSNPIGVKWQYQVTSTPPYYSDEGPWTDTTAESLGVAAYVGTTPEGLPVSALTADGIATAKAEALASTSALGLMTGYALDRRIRTDATQALSNDEKSQARMNLGAIDQAALDATANSIVIGSWADFAARTVLPSIAVVTSAAFDVLGYRGGARYVLDADQSDGVPTAYRKRSANGRWFVLDEPSPTMAQLGVIGTDTEAPNVKPDETTTIEAALAFCAARKLTLRMPGRHYWAKTLQLRSDLKIAGNDAWFRCIESTAPEFVSIQPGRNRFISIVGVGFAGANVPGQIGLHFDSRKSDTSADGGLWNSTIIAQVRNFAGHSVWLRGGNKRYMTGGAAYDYSTPIQFNTFSLDVERPAGNDTGCSLVMTGQCGQNYFVGQNRFDSRKTGEANVAGAVKGLNVYIGREVAAGALPGVPYDPASGATLGAFSGAVVDDLAPDTITMLATIQQAERGIWVDRATVVMLEGSYIEDLQRAVKLTATGAFSIDDSKFGNAGSDGNGGGYLVEYGAGCSLSGKGNYCIGYRDKLIVRPGATIGRNIDAEKFFTNFTSDPSGLTTGLTLDTSVTVAGEIVAAGYRSALVYGSTFEITKITTYTLAGAIHTFRCHSGYLIFGTGTNFVVPNGRVVLRPGDSISFRVLDIGARLQCMGVSRSELRAATIPTTGYYEAGEFVRSTVAPKAYGAFTTGWRRLTTGSAHVVDVDWRVEIQRERYQRTVSVGTAATAIMSVQKGNVNYGSDRIDVTVVGVDDSNGGRQFTDRIVVFGTVAQVIASDTINVSAASVAPAVRTYAVNGTDLTLAMASGAYSVRAVSQATPTGHLNLSSI